MATVNSSIAAHQEDLHNGHYISWPAYNVTSLLGAVILGYRGTQGFDAGHQYVTITSLDGTQFLRFGGYWNGSLDGGSNFPVGTPSSGSYAIGGNTRYYNGPYTAVLPGEVNLEDDLFADVEIIDTLDYAYDNFTGKVPSHPRSGPQAIHGGHVVDGAVGSRHLAKSHIARGNFAGGALQCVGGNTPAAGLVWVVNQADAVYFQTDDGSGDQGTAGRYRIAGPQPFLSPPVTARIIGASGNASQSINFPPAQSGNPNSPANCQLAFCRAFPGAASAPGLQAGGQLLAGTSYFLRFCLYQSLTISGYAQVIESALSQFVQINTPSDGVNNHSFSVVIPAVPVDPTGPAWTGYRIYMTSGDPANGGYDNPYSLLTSGTDYAQGGATGAPQTILVTTSPQIRGAASILPSMGFSGWPPGTDFTSSDWFAKTFMAIGLLSGTIDNNTGNYTITGWQSNTAQVGPHNAPPNTWAQKHLLTKNTSGGTINAPVPLMSDGQNLLYGTSTTQGGGSSITNGGVTLGLDGNGHTVETGGTTPSTSAFNGTYFSGQSWGAFSSDRRGMLVLTCNGTGIPAMTPLVTITFVTAYTSQPFPQVTGMSWRGGQAGLYAGAVAPAATHNPGPPGNASFTIYNANALAPIAGDNLSFMFEISG